MGQPREQTAILPKTYLQFALAFRALRAASDLSPIIARRPRSDGYVEMQPEWLELSDDDNARGSNGFWKDKREDSDAERQATLSLYREYTWTAMLQLHEIIDYQAEGDFKLELRARLMLAEILVRECQDTALAESLITKGVSVLVGQPFVLSDA